MRVKSSQTAARTMFREKTTASADRPVAIAMTISMVGRVRDAVAAGGIV
jgi:hypothetical protein